MTDEQILLYWDRFRESSMSISDAVVRTVRACFGEQEAGCPKCGHRLSLHLGGAKGRCLVTGCNCTLEENNHEHANGIAA